MQVHDTPLVINAKGATVTVTVGAGGADVYYGASAATASRVNGGTLAAAGSTFQVTAPTWVVRSDQSRAPAADISLVEQAPAATSTGGSGGGGGAITVPFTPSGARNTGDIVSQGGQLYTAISTGTNPASWDGTGYILGVAKGSTVIELNGSGTAIAEWIGNGTGIAATLVAPLLTSGVLNPRGAYAAGAAYSPGDVALGASGIAYLNVAASTGINPDTDVNAATGLGTKWYRIAPQGVKGDTGATGSPTTDQSILLRHLGDFARDPMLVTGHIAEAMDRRLATSNVALTSGTLQFTAIPVPGGRTFNNITMESGNIGVTGPTHQWFCLYDASRNKLAVTVDDTTTAWAASASKTLALTAPYTPAAGALLYVGICIVATTPNNLSGMGAGNPASLVPLLAGSSTAALTDPTTAPATAAALTFKAPFWASLS